MSKEKFDPRPKLTANKIERKCTACNRWTDGHKDHCNYCNELINPAKIQENELAEKLQRIKDKPKTKFEALLDRIENSQNPFVKFGYYGLKGIWIIYMAILAFFLYLIAFLPG